MAFASAGLLQMEERLAEAYDTVRGLLSRNRAALER
jgi:hypothetical protein